MEDTDHTRSKRAGKFMGHYSAVSFSSRGEKKIEKGTIVQEIMT